VPDLTELTDRLSGLTVMEALELTKMLEAEWGVSATAPVVVQQGPAPVEDKPPEQTEFEVILTGYGEAKVQVVRVVREITGLDLRAAMAVANEIPKPLKVDVSRAEADAIRLKIEAAGGTVEIK
jgi:large subunit ribosomal protein L7/L12